jgi:hypothetical protein
VQVPFPLNSRYAVRLEEGLEDWKTEVWKEKTIRVTADKRTTREQMIPNSQISPLYQYPASHPAFNPPLRLCRAVSKDFWKQRIAQAQSASAPRSRFDPIPIRQQI